MMALRSVLPRLFVVGAIGLAQADDDLALVQDYVRQHANDTFREPSGFLKHPYLVPAGPYEQCWDWDAVFTGVGLLDLGSAPYLAGSMMNFFEATDLETGNVTQCLDPTMLVPTCSSSNESAAVAAHAKPLLIQGALFAARALNNNDGGHGDGGGLSSDGGGVSSSKSSSNSSSSSVAGFELFRPYKDKMFALLDYWERERLDAKSGLYTWHDQMESGADNLVTSECPTSRSQDCWNEASDANTLAAADAAVELLRERRALAVFLEAWGEGGDEEEGSSPAFSSSSSLSGSDTGQAAAAAAAAKSAAAASAVAEKVRSRASDIAASVNAHLWDGGQGCFVALNTSTQQPINNSVYLAAFPLWGGPGVVSAERAAQVAARVAQPDLLSEFGLRSTSSADPRYSNENTIYPYSNWRGPVWVVANAVAAYGLATHGFKDQALDLAHRTTAALANDLRATGTWHECFDSSDGGSGEGLAADGFLSWNTLGYRLITDLQMGVDPFAID